MADDQDAGEQGAHPGNVPEEAMRAVHELVEALTAIGNYVAVAATIFGSADAKTEIRKVLEAASGQHERAATALRQLQRLLRR